MTEQRLKNIEDSFDIVETVGKGAYGAVSKAKMKGTNQIVALKKVSRDQIAMKNGFPENAMREIKILRALSQNENVVHLFKIESDLQTKDVYMVFEYCEFDLQGLIYQWFTSGKLPQEFDKYLKYVKCYFRQILQVIYFCHSRNIYHRDIKPSNIYVKLDNTIRMGDFGLAREFPKEKDKISKESSPWNVVTIWYRAPELCLGAKHYGPEIDNWSLGCVLYEMITGKVLFKSPLDNGKENVVSQLKSIISKCGTFDKWPEAQEYMFYEKNYKEALSSFHAEASSIRQYLEQVIPEEAKEAIPLMEGLLQVNPKERMSIREAFLHPFLASPNDRLNPAKLDRLTFDENHAMKTDAKRQQAYLARNQVARPKPAKM